MFDSYGRRINYIRVSVTDRCNLRCIYCLPEEGVPLKHHSEMLNYEEIEKVLMVAARLGVTRVRITGGEPLVRKGLVGFVRRLSASSRFEDISLTTNGVLFGEYARELMRAGVSRVNISLDTLKPERYRQITRWGDIADVLGAIEKALSLGYRPVKINTVIMRGLNDDEVADFVHLARSWPVHVRFIELMPLGENPVWSEGRHMPLEEIMTLLGPMAGEVRVEGSGPARYFALPGGKGSIGFISPISRHFCEDCNRVRLTADGKLNPCLASPREIDLRGPLRNGAGPAELERLVAMAIRSKPEKHGMGAGQAGGSLRRMSQIGG